MEDAKSTASSANDLSVDGDNAHKEPETGAHGEGSSASTPPPALTVPDIKELAKKEKDRMEKEKEKEETDKVRESPPSDRHQEAIRFSPGWVLVMLAVWVVMTDAAYKYNWAYEQNCPSPSLPSADDFEILVAAMKFDGIRLGDPVPNPKTGRKWAIPPPYITINDTRIGAFLPVTMASERKRVNQLRNEMKQNLERFDMDCITPSVFTTPWNALMIRGLDVMFYNVRIVDMSEDTSFVDDKSLDGSVHRLVHMSNSITIESSNGKAKITDRAAAHCIQSIYGNVVYGGMPSAKK